LHLLRPVTGATARVDPITLPCGKLRLSFHETTVSKKSNITETKDLRREDLASLLDGMPQD
jgi:hypothetical protein